MCVCLCVWTQEHVHHGKFVEVKGQSSWVTSMLCPAFETEFSCCFLAACTKQASPEGSGICSLCFSSSYRNAGIAEAHATHLVLCGFLGFGFTSLNLYHKHVYSSNHFSFIKVCCQSGVVAYTLILGFRWPRKDFWFSGQPGLRSKL